jgi:hypothetical protein
MSRSSGLAFTFAHQAMAQLNPPGGPDMRELFMQCANTKLIHGVRDPWLMNYVSQTSGITKYYRQSYDISAQDAVLGNVDPSFVCPNRDGQYLVQIQEYTAPRLSYQDILNISWHPNLSLVWINRASGLCPFRGWFPMYSEWPVSLKTHQQYQRQPWPPLSDQTIDVGSLWPDENAHTIVTDDQALAGPSSDQNTRKSLQAVWEDLKQKKIL